MYTVMWVSKDLLQQIRHTEYPVFAALIEAQRFAKLMNDNLWQRGQSLLGAFQVIKV